MCGECAQFETAAHFSSAVLLALSHRISLQVERSIPADSSFQGVYKVIPSLPNVQTISFKDLRQSLPDVEFKKILIT